MTDSKLYDLSTSEGFYKAFGQFNYLKDRGALIELKEVKKTRSNLQNRSLHLYFTYCANALNDCGFEFSYRDVKGMEIEIPWNGELFKSFVWRPIQITLFDFESTTQLTTEQINQILDVLGRHFAGLGITVQFPSKFELWVKELEKKGIY